jgi:hypothetical protein
MQNGFVESFNGRMGDECLNETLFDTLRHALHLVAAYGALTSTTTAHIQASRA